MVPPTVVCHTRANVVLLMSYIILIFAVVFASVIFCQKGAATRPVITSTNSYDAKVPAVTRTAVFTEKPDSFTFDYYQNHHFDQSASLNKKKNETEIAEPPVDSDSDDTMYRHHHEHHHKSTGTTAQISYPSMLESHPSFRTSPFELNSRWRRELPKWAQKQSRTGQSSIPSGQHVCFAHVGKAAGSTLGCSLGFQLHCRGIQRRRDGLLPLYTTNVIHNGMNDCPKHMPYYLFSTRNPVDRVRSAYLYDRPMAPIKAQTPHERHELKHKHAQDELYIDCPFWTLHDFVSNGLDPNGKASQRCKERAIKAVLGLERHGYHLYYNYQWFIQETQVMHPSSSTSSSSSSQILVVRTEHLAQDWNAAEAVLQSHSIGNNTNDSLWRLPQNHTDEKQFQHGNPSSWKAKDADAIFTDRDREVLCHFLCHEIQWYKQLLLQAVNLDSDDFFQSMLELDQTCPLQAKAGSCAPIDLYQADGK